jgi:hypothetical protein
MSEALKILPSISRKQQVQREKKFCDRKRKQRNKEKKIIWEKDVKIFLFSLNVALIISGSFVQ